jgi:ribulose bisphosphate carboxylase small subunit
VGASKERDPLDSWSIGYDFGIQQPYPAVSWFIWGEHLLLPRPHSRSRHQVLSFRHCKWKSNFWVRMFGKDSTRQLWAVSNVIWDTFLHGHFTMF